MQQHDPQDIMDNEKREVTNEQSEKLKNYKRKVKTVFKNGERQIASDSTPSVEDREYMRYEDATNKLIDYTELKQTFGL